MTEPEYKAIRKQNLDLLHARGFQPAASLPTGPRDESEALRPLNEIATRLWALNTVFLYVAAPSAMANSKEIKNCIAQNDLARLHEPQEVAMLTSWRWLSRRRNMDSVGWYLENMLSLAWILGFEIEPELDGTMVDGELIHKMVGTFIGDVKVPINQWLGARKPRDERTVIEKEDLFYCAHNAVRSAQLGGSTVPAGFHPLVNGGVIHERRHSLTWAISPGVSWEETDLST